MKISKLSIVLGALLCITICLYFIGCYTTLKEKNQNNIITPAQEAPLTDKLTVVTPSKTDYIGSGRTISRDVKIWGFVDIMGLSAGELIARMEPMKLDEESLPAINIDGVGGLSTTEGGGSTMSSGGFRWSILDTIWMWFKKLIWFGIIGVVVLVAVFFLVPGAQPFIAGIGRFFASLFPFVGSIVERLSAKSKWQIPLKQTVTAGDKFRSSITNSSDFSAKQKTRIIELFKSAMTARQDKRSQNTVDKIRIENK